MEPIRKSIPAVPPKSATVADQRSFDPARPAANRADTQQVEAASDLDRWRESTAEDPERWDGLS